MPDPQTDMIRGTLDMLVLKVVSLEPMHGWGISERIQQISDEALQVNQGSLYSSLHRLKRQGWIRYPLPQPAGSASGVVADWPGYYSSSLLLTLPGTRPGY